MRGISLEEISESTKIGTRSLRALEEEDFERLPGGIFNKGFVRAYSRFLGLDEEEAVADFDAAWREHEAEKGPLTDLQPEVQAEQPEPSANRLILITAILLLAIAAVGYAVKHYLNARAENNPTSQSEVQPAASSSSDAGRQPVSPAESPISKPADSAAVNPDSNQSKSQPSPADVAAKSNPALTQKPRGTEVSGASSASAAILLEVTALEDSWLSVSADGKSLGQGILGAQKSRTIRANKEVRLRVGNVAGVEVSFNGKPVNIDGEPRQVKELTFTPEGLH